MGQLIRIPGPDPVVVVNDTKFPYIADSGPTQPVEDLPRQPIAHMPAKRPNKAGVVNVGLIGRRAGQPVGGGENRKRPALRGPNHETTFNETVQLAVSHHDAGFTP